jgi:hypothetical protein
MLLLQLDPSSTRSAFCARELAVSVPAVRAILSVPSPQLPPARPLRRGHWMARSGSADSCAGEPFSAAHRGRLLPGRHLPWRTRPCAPRSRAARALLGFSGARAVRRSPRVRPRPRRTPLFGLGLVVVLMLLGWATVVAIVS